MKPMRVAAPALTPGELLKISITNPIKNDINISAFLGVRRGSNKMNNGKI
ncbi:hypothetical protein [Membranihabitans maritimus]|nr:hypothetical protein [Membranihabitans maritimus]